MELYVKILNTYNQGDTRFIYLGERLQQQTPLTPREIFNLRRKLKSHHRILAFPILTNGHWILFEYDMKRNVAYYGDPTGDFDEPHDRFGWFDEFILDPLLIDTHNHKEPVAHAEDYKEELPKEVEEFSNKMDCRKKRIGQLERSMNCGLFIMAYMEARARGDTQQGTFYLNEDQCTLLQPFL